MAYLLRRMDCAWWVRSLFDSHTSGTNPSMSPHGSVLSRAEFLPGWTLHTPTTYISVQSCILHLVFWFLHQIAVGFRFLAKWASLCHEKWEWPWLDALIENCFSALSTQPTNNNIINVLLSTHFICQSGRLVELSGAFGHTVEVLVLLVPGIYSHSSSRLHLIATPLIQCEHALTCHSIDGYSRKRSIMQWKSSLSKSQFMSDKRFITRFSLVCA